MAEVSSSPPNETGYASPPVVVKLTTHSKGTNAEVRCDSTATSEDVVNAVERADEAFALLRKKGYEIG